MASKDALKHLLDSLDSQQSAEEKLITLQNIQVTWEKLHNAEVMVAETVRGCNLFNHLANVIEENFESWKHGFPEWITGLMFCVFEYTSETDLFPLDQMTLLVNTFRKYIIDEYWSALGPFRFLSAFPAVQQLLFTDEDIYNVLKKVLTNRFSLVIFINVTSGMEEWQQKILEDKQLVLDLISLPESNDVWNLFAAIAQHPDAKTLLPKEVLVKASKSANPRCIDICALLCNDEDLNLLHLGTEWIDKMSGLLESLLTKGYARIENMHYGVLNVVLPIVNVSVMDSYKGELGGKVVKLLLKLLLDEFLNVEKAKSDARLAPMFKRGAQETTRALWNFAYVESNRKQIDSVNGINQLNYALEKTDDPIVKKNILGILHMFTSTTSTPTLASSQATESSTKGKHVMISYNWGNQKIVKRIAKSLQDLGYDVWLDVEQMEGSTLEAMAGAVEGSELVLICMSQKYKDSPNCRLEGEYCVNRKIAFVPLLMQSGYRPDGWLGLALGAKLYYEFFDESNWDSKMAALAKAIGERGKRGFILGPKKEVEGENKRKPIAEWTLEDVREWLKAEHLEHNFEFFEKHKFNGRALLELQALHSPSNPGFFVTICEKLGISEIGEILQLSAAVRKL